jgi:hypothetical protein
MFAALVRDRDGLAPELTDVRRFHHEWEKRASVELRAGSPTPSTPTKPTSGSPRATGTRCSTPSTRPGRTTPRTGKTSLMIAGDLGTVSELNARARADRVAAGQVVEDGLAVAGGGDRRGRRPSGDPPERPAPFTGRRWVRNGDQWTRHRHAQPMEP